MTTAPRLGVASVVCLLLIFTPLAQATIDSGVGLSLGDRLTVAGSADVTVPGEAALHYHGSGQVGELELEADEITLDYSYERGRSAGTPWEENFQETSTGQGHDEKRVANATVSVSPWGSKPEILVYPDRGEHRTSVSTTSGQTVGHSDAQFLTRVGTAPDSGSTNGSRDLGFWYESEDDWIVSLGGDRAVAEGDFSLFLNNLTVTVSQDGERAWENWTGYRVENTGPFASTYERHLLKVHVTNGTLALTEDDGLSVFGPLLDVQADGIVTAETATGRLDLGEASFAFDDQPLRMEGEGSFRVRESQADPVGGLLLSVDEGSRFDVHGGRPIDTGLAGSGDLAGWRLWAPVSLLGLAVTGVLAHRAGYASQALEGWRSRRYTKWMTRGRELANGGDYSSAAPCFRRATRAQPVKGVGWYHLAIALLEDGRPREMLEVIDEAREGEAVIDELDFLDLEAQAARRVGDLERCRAAVAQLADGSPAMARTLVGELGLSEEVLGHELATRLSWQDEEGDGEGLPGYV